MEDLQQEQVDDSDRFEGAGPSAVLRHPRGVEDRGPLKEGAGALPERVKISVVHRENLLSRSDVKRHHRDRRFFSSHRSTTG